MSLSNSLFQKAKTLFRQNQFTHAIKAYNLIIEKYPQSHKAWNNLGLCYLKLEDYKNGIIAFENALKRKQDGPLVWKNLGKAYYHIGDYQKVIDTYQKALELFPENDFFWNGIGIVYNHMENYAQAIEAHKNALNRNLHNTSTWFHLCHAYCKTGVDFDPNEFKPNSEVSWLKLSKCLLVAGLYQDALFAIDRCLELNPSFNIAHAWRTEIKNIIKDNAELRQVKEQQTDACMTEVERDQYYERFKKMQQAREKLLKDTQNREMVTIEERFKAQQAKFKSRVQQINRESSNHVNVVPDLPVIEKPIIKAAQKARYICINNTNYNIDKVSIVVDGANVAREDCTEPNSGKIINLYKLFDKLRDIGIDNYLVICDRSLYYTIDNKIEYAQLVQSGKIIEGPAGTEADHFILKYAKDNDSFIISNDLFREFRRFFGKAWLNAKRLTFKFIQGKLYFDKIYTTL